MQTSKQSQRVVVWRPLPGTSQEIALDSRAQHTLYTGARGPGKTDTQLMRFRRKVGKGYGSYWRGVIFDRQYKNLDDLVSKSKRWFLQFNDGCKFLSSSKDYKWIWPTGEELLFRVAKDMIDYWDYHGQEFPFIGFNELTKYPTGEVYDAMRSINRSSYDPLKDGWVGGIFDKEKGLTVGPKGELPEPMFLEFFSTCNPWGPGHAWVKRDFIDVAQYGVIHTKVKKNVLNPRTQQREDIRLTQVAIFGTYKENIYLDPIYVANLEGQKDPNRRKAWLAGDWNIVSGGAIDDLWNLRIHKVPRFEIPSNWYVNRAFDWGSTKPYACIWFAESNGEEITWNGLTKSFPAGSIIVIGELYGADETGTNVGRRESARKVAQDIIKYEKKLKGFDGITRKWVHAPFYPGPADNQISNVIDTGEETIETKMADVGCEWEKSNKSKGSREIGLQLLRDRLEASLNKEGAGFYVMEHCTLTLALLPTLPRDEDNPDDIDTTSEDHIWDAIRYRLLAGVRKLAVGTDKLDVEMG